VSAPCEPSAISYQLSAISHQLSAFIAGYYDDDERLVLSSDQEKYIKIYFINFYIFYAAMLPCRQWYGAGVSVTAQNVLLADS
jgi:hypothetical protein